VATDALAREVLLAHLAARTFLRRLVRDGNLELAGFPQKQRKSSFNRRSGAAGAVQGDTLGRSEWTRHGRTGIRGM